MVPSAGYEPATFGFGRRCSSLRYEGVVVPGTGIEPVTPGFSDPCSTL